MEITSQIIYDKFKSEFNSEPLIIRSPGRINLIGEHTDYNDGFVLPAAIDKEIFFAIAKSNNSFSTLYSVDFNDAIQFIPDSISKSETGWVNYILGVIDQLNQRGLNIENFDCLFGGNIPIGAGLSSSAALECGIAFGLNELFNLNLSKIDIIKIGKQSENEFVGVQCGIMDQFINVLGKEDHVLRLDCRTLEYDYFPFDFEDVTIILFNSGVSHSLASSEYNKRRQECEAGVEILKRGKPEIKNLRDVDSDYLASRKDDFDKVTFDRCSYVVSENERLLEACKELSAHNLKRVGELMLQTHDGLSNKYNVSCDELDFLVEVVRNDPKVYGARMMGGGFGGCTINLVEKRYVEELREKISRKYFEKYGVELESYTANISKGVELITLLKVLGQSN